MHHTPIQISNLSLSFGDTLCFADFNYTLYPGEKIAIIGDNGSGKSSLLRHILALCRESHITVGYVPQIIDDLNTLSGGQRFNKKLSLALAESPSILLLDEPTNHLDKHNRQSLMRLLKQHTSTQIIVSHDMELLNHHIDTLWHIVDGQIRVFHGKYTYYLEQLQQEKEQLASQLSQLKRAQKAQHEALMTEQERRKKKKAHGEKKYDKDKIALRSAQGRGERTANKNNAYLNQVKSYIADQKNQLWQPEEIHYTFDIISGMDKKSGISIQDGSCGYESPFLNHIHLHISGGSRIALEGPNGSGKSLLVKAILNDPSIQKTGEWVTPLSQDIAYLDQHYSLLPQDKTVLEHLETLNASFTHAEWRYFLNQFLFRKNDEVHRPIHFLSGGEKARLSLAAIALQRPKLMILDEVTNNIDLTTKNHITQILKTYTGTLLIISHEADFLRAIDVSESYNMCHWKVIE